MNKQAEKDYLLGESPGMAFSMLVEQHEKKWKDRSDWYWLWRLIQEVWELVGVMVGWHNDSMDWEILQISAIAFNWLRKRKNQ